MWTLVFRTMLGATLAGVMTATVGAQQPRSDAQARLAFSQPLPVLDGAHLEAKLVDVTYPPGGKSAPHRHPCAVVGYMLAGTMRMKVNDAEHVYKAGDTFYESPNDVHRSAVNPSATEPARFLAYFTCDRNTPLSVAVPDTGSTKP